MDTLINSIDDMADEDMVNAQRILQHQEELQNMNVSAFSHLLL